MRRYNRGGKFQHYARRTLRNIRVYDAKTICIVLRHLLCHRLISDDARDRYGGQAEFSLR